MKKIFKMKSNVGGKDRLIRAIVGAVMIYWLATSSPILGSIVVTVIISVFAGFNLLSSALSWCAIYSIFGLSTKK